MWLSEWFVHDAPGRDDASARDLCLVESDDLVANPYVIADVDPNLRVEKRSRLKIPESVVAGPAKGDAGGEQAVAADADADACSERADDVRRTVEDTLVTDLHESARRASPSIGNERDADATELYADLTDSDCAIDRGAEVDDEVVIARTVS